MENIHGGMADPSRGANPAESEQFIRKNEIVLPAVDQFLSEDIENSQLPEELIQNPDFREQAKLRRELISQLNQIFSQAPDVTFDLDSILDSESLNDFYRDLSSFLKADRNNARIILYLPFEFLPGRNRESKGDSAQFREAYLEAWRYLLSEDDVRANFAFGDVVESEIAGRPPERVYKAAHLIPWLLKKELITIQEVVQLLETDDVVLKQSVVDTVPVLFDLNLISDEYRDLFSQVLNSKDDFSGTLSASEEKDRFEIKGKELIEEMLVSFRQKLGQIDVWYDREKNSPSAVVKARVEWQKIYQKEQVVRQIADELSLALERQQIDRENLEGFMAIGEAPMVAAVLAIKKTIEKRVNVSKEEAVTLNDQFGQLMEDAWQGDSARTKDEVLTAWSHFAALGIIPSDYLGKHGVVLPDLEQNSSLGRDKFSKEVPQLDLVIESIKAEPGFQAIYPAFIFFGSRVKGYANVSADLDLAMLFRPGADFGERQQLKEKFHTLVAGVDNLGKVVDFWLERRGDDLAVRDILPPDNTLADSDWAHVLLGGVWYGDQGTVKDVFQRVVRNYLDQGSEMTRFGVDKRAVWLREIEREVLQYRLMHKGYDRYFPRRGGLEAAHRDSIDGDSAFYDSGFRRLATKLFLKKVFLPEIKK